MQGSERGGKRKGSGRKSEWSHQPTINIRVPEALAPQLLAIARELDKRDSGTFIIDRSSGNFNRQQKASQARLHLSGVRIYQSGGHKVIRLSELVSGLQEYIDAMCDFKDRQNGVK